MRAHHVASLSIAVVERGRIVWARAYGFVDVAGQTPATTQTAYQAGSISKPVAASAAMRLVERGRLTLDGDLNSQLKSWRIPDSPYTAAQPVTLRELLTHTGGVTVSSFLGYAAGAPTPDVIQVLEGKPPANTPAVVVDQTPGMTWRYSGGGFTIVQLLMMDVTGRSFPDLMRETVLAPLGMNRSTYEEPLPESWRAAASTGYLANGDPVPGRFRTYPEMAAAGLWTTPSDLAKWAIALERAYNGEPSPLMSRASARAMLTPGLGRWGLGIQVRSAGQDLWFLHDGDDLGFKATLVGWPSGERAIIVMASGDDSYAVVAPLAHAVARHYGWKGLVPDVVAAAPISAAQRQEVVGAYGHGAFVISLDGETLTAKFLGRTAELLPQGSDRFLAIAGGTAIDVTLARSPDRTIKSLTAGGFMLNRDH
jgi:CubicO group peptidase (beta-lactamase class C family)